ncbi:hypothetical protein D3C81_1782440 [compost metagenome]
MQAFLTINVQRGTQRCLLFYQQFFTNGFQGITAEDLVMYCNYGSCLRLGQGLAQRQF